MAGPRFGRYARVGDTECAAFEDFGAEKRSEWTGRAGVFGIWVERRL
jgi:hypothetical protein